MIIRQMNTKYVTSFGLREITELGYLNRNGSVLLVELSDGKSGTLDDI